MADKTQLYKRRIIKELYFHSPLSSAELCLKSNRSLPVTTKILNDLIEQGAVSETGLAPSTGGRRPATFALRSDAHFVVSVAMDQFVTRIAIMDMRNTVVYGIEKFELPLPNNSSALQELTRLIGQCIAHSGIEKTQIIGIGIGMPGFIDVRKGLNYSFLPVTGTNITGYISKELHLPVFIDNDSSLIALAELRFGAARNRKNAMVLNISWGIGLGMIVSGELFRGHNGFAGEFSHIPLFSNGKMCSCGKRGCLETETSLLVIVRKAIEGLKEGRLSVLKTAQLEQFEEASEALFHAVKGGDQFAIELLSDAGYHIGRGVSILVHLMNPEVVVLSGRGTAAGKVWQAPIQQAMNEHCIPKLAGDTTIELSSLGYQAELIGAVALVMDHYDKLATDIVSTKQSMIA